MIRALTIAAALFLPAVAFAAGGGGGGGHHEGGIPLTEIGLHAINFAILMGVVVYFGRGPVRDALKDRAAETRRSLDESNRLRAEAQTQFEELEARMARFEQMVDQMRDDAIASADREVHLIEQKTQADVAQIRSAAERTIRDELANARFTLRKQAVDLAVDIATDRLREQVGAADQDRLARDLLGSIKPEVNGHG